MPGDSFARDCAVPHVVAGWDVIVYGRVASVGYAEARVHYASSRDLHAGLSYQTWDVRCPSECASALLSEADIALVARGAEVLSELRSHR
jgi:hypothetical protein